MKTVKMKCGCICELHREAWVSLCPVHEAETKATHERWAEEHRNQRKLTILDLKPRKKTLADDLPGSF